MKKFILFGNPIKQSKSPIIHEIFSKQEGLSYTYKKKLVFLNEFNLQFNLFFNNGGNGANITSPYKELAYKKVNLLSMNALISKSINTIKKTSNKKLLGYNTDGIGLVLDLKRLNFIKKGMNILIIGAGGAASNIIYSLLQEKCKISITNRTFNKAKKIKEKFFFDTNIKPIKMEKLRNKKYDLIINATSCSLFEKVPKITRNIFKENVFFYDMCYNKKQTCFIEWAKLQGIKKYSNGLGMLIYQAAFSFKLWNNFFPNVKEVIKKMDFIQKVNFI
ncbi:MAG: shikimate dehydrogenase [Arsenophonus sp.]|nr:MAG: shikimate dehydrogenase [Arsenophonus sp.]